MRLDLMQPAEWAPHRAVWVAWPSAAELWMENLGPAQEAFVAMCEAICDVDPGTGEVRGERLELLVPAGRRDEAVRRLGHLSPRLHEIPFGDIWLRDTAPIFTRDPAGHAVASRFRFNGWGGKYVLPGDDRVSERIALASGLESVQHDFILEGGSVEVDGQGSVLTTRQCLLNPNRNPDRDEETIEERLRGALGVTRVLWLDEGLLHDHTDGHVDTIARFVRPGVVVCMEAAGTDDPNAEVLDAIRTSLLEMHDAHGRKLEVTTIPSPGRILDAAGEVMPASYVNFYVGNRSVVVPTYGSAWDEPALRAVEKLFPGRRTLGVPAKVILTGGGAFHCITQQEPAGPGAGGTPS